MAIYTGSMAVKFKADAYLVKDEYVIKDLTGQFMPLYENYHALAEYGRRFDIFEMKSKELDGRFKTKRFRHILDKSGEGLIWIRMTTDLSKDFVTHQINTMALIFNETPHCKVVMAHYPI